MTFVNCLRLRKDGCMDRATKLAWVAGIAIGEGSFSNAGSRPRKDGTLALRFGLSMYDEVAVRRFVEYLEPEVSRMYKWQETNLSVKTWIKKPQGTRAYGITLGQRQSIELICCTWRFMEGTMKGDQALRCCEVAGVPIRELLEAA